MKESIRRVLKPLEKLKGFREIKKKKYIIQWESLLTGLKGQGETLFTFSIIKDIVYKLNYIYKDELNHYSIISR